MFCRKYESVEKDEDDDEPVEPLRLNHSSTRLGAASIQLLESQSVVNASIGDYFDFY